MTLRLHLCIWQMLLYPKQFTQKVYQIKTFMYLSIICFILIDRLVFITEWSKASGRWIER